MNRKELEGWMHKAGFTRGQRASLYNRERAERLISAVREDERNRLAAEFTKRAEALSTTGAGCAPHVQAQYEAMAGELLDWAGALRA